MNARGILPVIYQVLSLVFSCWGYPSLGQGRYPSPVLPRGVTPVMSWDWGTLG